LRIFLTGATGFIGSHVARILVRNGHKVHALIYDKDLSRISDIIPSLELIPGDMLESEKIGALVASIKPEICIHLAWYVEPGKYLDSLENIKQLTASLEFATQLSSLGCKKLVVAGTCFEYDTTLGYLSETTPLKPNSLYASCKLALHLTLEQLAAKTGIQVAWVRFFYQYGPFEDERRLVSSVICSLLRKKAAKLTRGEQIRDFLHVEDVASAVCAVAKSDVSGPVNIGSGKPVTVRELVTTIGSILNKTDLLEFGALPYSESDPMFICANNSRLVNNTTWKPRFGLRDGLEQTVEWWQKHLHQYKELL
jgi:nucleoside-diphosphate-sugar epimerase